LSFWLLNSILLYLAELILPSYYVLGNFWLSGPAAMLWSGFWMTVVVWVAKPVSLKLNLKLKGRQKMFIFYWLANSVAIWILARLAHLSGLGIAAFYWAIFLGLVANITQWGLWQGLKRAKLTTKR